jgi:outer membrane lipoprotein-sorting protein
MTCPTDEDWTLVSMDLLDEDRTEWMREHLQTCQECRVRFNEARRDHVGLLRAYEASDRDHDVQRERLLAALPAEVPQPGSKGWIGSGWRRLGEWTMNNPRTRRAAGLFSAAAVIAIAVSVFVRFGDGVAFADVIERLQHVHSIVCRIATNTTAVGQDIAVEGKMYMSSDYGMRCDFAVFGQPATSLFKSLDDPAIVVTPMTKSYMVIEGEDDNGSFDHMRDPDAFLRRLTELTEDASESLGRDLIDGREVVSFAISAEQLELGSVDASAQLHVDAETELPVQFALEMPGPDPGSHIKVLYDQFEFDTPLEADLFAPAIPEDYVQINVQLPPQDEETLIGALRIYAELTGGSYPEELNALAVVTEVARLAGKQMVAEGQIPTPGSAAYETLNQKLMEVGTAFEFYQRLVRDGREPEYFGREVTAADGDAVLMQWRQDDSRLRVIYVNLTVETVPDGL